MKYQDKTFSVPYMSKEYSNNWEKTFKSKKIEVRPGDLVAVKEERYYWFGIVEEINQTPPHSDAKFCVKISFFDISSGIMSHSWESKENTYFIKRNVMEELK